jgi:hypothetical protein
MLNLLLLQILPVAFIASHDESSSAAAAWTPVWTEGCPSEPAALRLHTPELAGLISGALQSSSWGRKRSGAKVGQLTASAMVLLLR